MTDGQEREALEAELADARIRLDERRRMVEEAEERTERLALVLQARDNELGLLRANKEALVRRITGLEEFAREVAAREDTKR